MKAQRLRYLGAVLTLSVTACSHIAPPIETETQQGNKAVRGLLQEARDQRLLGNYGLANAKLERALRLEPRYATLWLELAKNKQAEALTEQARSLALKALSLASDPNTKQETKAFLDSL